jgi:SAM-dependent methyltransferase
VSLALRRLEFVQNYFAFKRMASRLKPRLPMQWQDRYPCLFDNMPATPFDRHYLYHVAWAARVLSRTNPPFHVDISSSLNFSTVVSAFIPVKFYDYRPPRLQLTNLYLEQASLVALPFPDQNISSLSCMHVVEHIGLGRYGDELDPDGDLKAIRELKRVLKQNGSLLFVVPIGKPRIRFNAHRIYSYEQISESFQELKLEEFALIPDRPQDGGLIVGATQQMADAQSYGCGCFWFKKT